MKHNDLDPRSLVQPRDSSRSCLPSAGHVCLHRNKLTIQISCQLFLNKQYQRRKYIWLRNLHNGITGGVSTSTQMSVLPSISSSRRISKVITISAQMHKSCIVLAMFCIQNRCSRLCCIILRGKYNHARSSSKLSLPP